jgi:hypothetical protein
VQGGELRVFSATSLLIQLTTSLALFAIATVITDFAALYLLPDAKVPMIFFYYYFNIKRACLCHIRMYALLVFID